MTLDPLDSLTDVDLQELAAIAMHKPKTALTKAYERINELNLDPNKVCSHQGKTMTLLEVAHQMFLDKEAFELRELEKSQRDRSLDAKKCDRVVPTPQSDGR